MDKQFFGGFFFHQGNSNYNSTVRDAVVIMIGSLPCLEGFSSGCPVFFPPQTQHTKFQFDLEMRAKGLPALLLSVTLNKVDCDNLFRVFWGLSENDLWPTTS